MTTRVYLELGRKRTFACAVDWPGWARSAPRRAAMGDPDAETAALDALAAYLPRYAAVLAAAGIRGAGPSLDDLDVVQRLPGDATTDFGAPSTIPDVDREPLGDGEGGRLAARLDACWQTLDAVAAGAPAELRKGPRGGGRDRDAVVGHVTEAERNYLRTIGLRFGPGTPPGQWRTALLDGLRGGTPALGGSWPVRYVVRRAAWHVLDHAWEIEDRST
jgi:hypothetical protein